MEKKDEKEVKEKDNEEKGEKEEQKQKHSKEIFLMHYVKQIVILKKIIQLNSF